MGLSEFINLLIGWYGIDYLELRISSLKDYYLQNIIILDLKFSHQIVLIFSKISEFALYQYIDPIAKSSSIFLSNYTLNN